MRGEISWPWEAVADDGLVERLILEMQRGVRTALTGSDALDRDVPLPIPEAATALLNLLASVLEPSPGCATPQAMRRMSEAAAKELLVLMRGVRAIKGPSTGGPH